MIKTNLTFILLKLNEYVYTRCKSYECVLHSKFWSSAHGTTYRQEIRNNWQGIAVYFDTDFHFETFCDSTFICWFDFKSIVKSPTATCTLYIHKAQYVVAVISLAKLPLTTSLRHHKIATKWDDNSYTFSLWHDIPTANKFRYKLIVHFTSVIITTKLNESCQGLITLWSIIRGIMWIIEYRYVVWNWNLPVKDAPMMTTCRSRDLLAIVSASESVLKVKTSGKSCPGTIVSFLALTTLKTRPD